MNYEPYDNENYAKEAGILAGVESFLRGLSSNVRTTLSAGDVADIVLSMIDDLRKSGRRENQ